MVNESLTVELKRYKERVAIFEQRLNVDLNKSETLIDSQMDELIRNRNAKFTAFQQEIDTLKQTLSNHVQEKESLSTTLTVFKTKIKEKESKYFDKEIVLEKQNKELENILFLKDKFNAFDKTLLDEITEVQTVFNQMEVAVDQCSSQEKDTIIRKLKDMIKSLSGKDSVKKLKKDIDEIETINIELEHRKTIVDTAVSIPIATTIAPEMFKLDIEPISHRLNNNRDAHEDYLKKTIENTDTIRGLVERARKQNPSEPLLDSACMFTKHVQELLVYVSKTCPSLTKPSEKLVVVTPLNKDKKFRFADPLTSSSNTQKHVESHITQDSNKPLLHSTRVKCSTGASRSKPSGNTKNNKIS
ncbi:hypothetical protein Tco_0713045 [Tanacetum coccineum]